MKWPLFENKIKDELSGHRSEVDIDALWSAIEPEVDAINKSKRKRRFGIIWFLFAGAMLLGSGAAFYFFGNNDGKNDPVISENISEIGTGNEIELNENNATEENYGSNKISGLNIDSNSKTEIENNKRTGSKTGPVLENKIENKNGSRGNLNKKTGENIPLKTSIKGSHKEIDGMENSGGRDKTAPFRKGPIVNNAPKMNAAQLPGFDNTTSEQPLNTATAPAFNDENASNNSYFRPIQKIGVLPVLPFEIKRETPQVRVQPLKNVLSGGVIADGPESGKHSGGTPPNNKKSFCLSVGLNGGVSFSDRKLAANDSLGNEILKYREPNEKQLETSHLGLQINMRHQSGFEISSGLQYTRIVELFNYHKNITTTDSIFDIAYYAVNPNNDTLAVMGMVPLVKHLDILKRYYNRYTMFDIPVLVGYYKKNDGWVYGAQAGVFANIFLKTKGRFLKNETEDGEIKDLLKNKVAMSYYIGLTGGYKLNDNLEINISPYLRYFPQNFAKESYPISQKYMLIGLDARVRYWF